MTIEIDLREMLDPLVNGLRAALNNFVLHHPDIEVCTVGFQGDGFHGSVSLAIDTPAHSAAHVEKWAPKGRTGVDEHGSYCDNCPDMAYWVTDHSLVGFPDLYEVNEGTELIVRRLDRTVHTLSSDAGDHEMHVAIAEPLLRSAANLFMPFEQLPRTQPFRVVLQFIADEPIEVLSLPPTSSTDHSSPEL